MYELLDICINAKVFLQVSNFDFHYHEDGSYVDFRISSVSDIRNLLEILINLDVKIFSQEKAVIIRVFEDYIEY